MRALVAACIVAACCVLVWSCGQATPEAKTADLVVQNTDTQHAQAETAEQIDEEVFEEREVAYITVVDTSGDYALLDSMMYVLSGYAGIGVDTMNRHFDAQKDEIVLAEDDDDEMYRGAYYPRLMYGCNLSIEHYATYDTSKQASCKALIAGIWEDRHFADSLAQALKPVAGNTFVQETMLYRGCMH